MKYRCQSCGRFFGAEQERSTCSESCPSLTVAGRFWAKVKIKNDCWVWTGASGGRKREYGLFVVEGKFHQATHVAWALSTGRWPTSEMLLHECDNPPCVRPSHLREGDAAMNTADMILRNRAGWQTHPETFRQLAANMRQKYREASNPTGEANVGQ